jgi:pimeloyl-ACP methyl ester carboxylesterase
MEKVSFKTEDDVTIVGNFYPCNSPDAIILLHMMPATKESWEEFTSVAQEYWNLLAIDLRGHGESIKVNGEMLEYQHFSDGVHQKSIRDIKAADKFLDDKELKTFALVGASIGANLALWYQTENSEIQKSVLLSPGFNYRGIEAEPLIGKLSENQGIYLVGGREDTRKGGHSAGETAQKLYKISNQDKKEYEILNTSMHGTDMFSYDPNLVGRIVKWLRY